MMKVPDHVKTYDNELATFWFDEQGILCAIAKSTPRTLQKQMETYAFIHRITGDKKICLLSDATHSGQQDKETRDYSSGEMPKLFKAMAILSDSPTGNFVSSLYMVLKHEPVPMRMFSNEQEAHDWLKTFL
ncbi:MAG: hypothetical protein ACJ77K_18890 [Bacteroidia bacterium]|jgi:hypothetical protein